MSKDGAVDFGRELYERAKVTARLVDENERLRAALHPFALLFERYENVQDLQPDEVVVPYVALAVAAKALEERAR